jgi:hypothetical protein
MPPCLRPTPTYALPLRLSLKTCGLTLTLVRRTTSVSADWPRRVCTLMSPPGAPKPKAAVAPRFTSIRSMAYESIRPIVKPELRSSVFTATPLTSTEAARPRICGPLPLLSNDISLLVSRPGTNLPSASSASLLTPICLSSWAPSSTVKDAGMSATDVLVREAEMVTVCAADSVEVPCDDAGRAMLAMAVAMAVGANQQRSMRTL